MNRSFIEIGNGRAERVFKALCRQQHQSPEKMTDRIMGKLLRRGVTNRRLVAKIGRKASLCRKVTKR